MSKYDNTRYVRESRERRKAEGYIRIDVQVPKRDVDRFRKIARNLCAEYEIDRARAKEKTDG